MEPGGRNKRSSLIGRVWRSFTTPSAHFSFGAILLYGIFAGIVFWGGFHWAIELSNTETFCLSCHEMRAYVYPEVAASRHYNNQSGVRAICTDCHVPKDWAHKLTRKIVVTRELYYHLLGTLATREKFESKRLEMAERVWASMRQSDSRECRNCHAFNAMDLLAQEGLAARQHQLAAERGVTCIECHMGIAHALPDGAPERQLIVDLR